MEELEYLPQFFLLLNFFFYLIDTEFHMMYLKMLCSCPHLYMYFRLKDGNRICIECSSI